MADVFPNPDRAAFVDRPFGCPPDIVLDLPVPPSVNETRKINRAGIKKVQAWKSRADAALIGSGQYREAKRRPVLGKYELTIILDKTQTKMDLGNCEKSLSDYLKRIELITDDGPNYAQQILIKWGDAPSGCRLILRGAV